MNRYDQLCAYVAEVDNNLGRMQAVAESFADVRHTVPIPGEFGTVTVSGNGKLLSVELHRDTPMMTRGKPLGQAIMRAIRQAEEEMREIRKRRISAAQRDVTLDITA